MPIDALLLTSLCGPLIVIGMEASSGALDERQEEFGWAGAAVELAEEGSSAAFVD